MSLTVNSVALNSLPSVKHKKSKAIIQPDVSEKPLTMSRPSAKLLQVYFTGKVNKPETILGTANVQEREAIQAFGKQYVDFLEKAKTNLSAVHEILKMARANGYKEFNPDEKVKPGDKVYFVNNDRAVVLSTIGNNPIASGVKIIGSHLDSPCITLKAKPLQDSEGFCIFKTMVHGGIKRNHWVNRHLALEGKVVKKDGTEVKINVGNKQNENTFIIPDLAPHVESDKTKSTRGMEFDAEQLNPVVALNTDMEGKISDYVEKILKEKYGIDKNDLLNAELHLVPAENPRGVGFDEGLVGAYGHDDKSAVFANLKAEVDLKNTPAFTTVSAFFGNEEIGSYNNYGAKSEFFGGVIGSLIENQKGSFNENDMRRAMKKSLALSADVSTAVDPIQPKHEEKTNACRLGQGVIMKLQGWRNSIPEATATVTNLFRNNDVKFQPFAYHQDMGGGATIGVYLATNYNLDVVDIGIPILSMHAPVEIADKGDVYHLYKGMKAFMNSDHIKMPIKKPD
ncbi:MAG: aminopeptidase 1 [Cyanobacteriota bacterium]